MLKRRALALHNAGLTTREIGLLLKKSHAWAAYAILEMERELNIPVDNTK